MTVEWYPSPHCQAVGPCVSWEKGRAIGINIGRELVMFAYTVSGASCIVKYSWGKTDIN